MDLSIIIVSYNSRDLLTACLQSIIAARSALSVEILVVDNDSTDGSVPVSREQFPGVTFIENKKNLGFARAVNIGLGRASGKYWLVLNPDIEVSTGSLESLVSYMTAHPDVALASPKLLYPDGTLQYSCRTDYSLKVLLFRRTLLATLFPDHPVLRDHLMMDWDHASTREVDWVLGAAFMIRREAIRGQPVMDERFFLYFEDVDLCLRLRKEGWRVVYHPEAVMVHHHQRASAHGFLTRAKIEHLKSWLKFEWKHRGGPLVRSTLTKPWARFG
jgi:GT2 family glycosyltransferase